MTAATQVLRNSGESLRVSFYVDGALTDPDGNAATVTITKDSDGSAVVTDGTATKISTGLYAYSLAAQANLDRFTAQWTGTFTGLVQTVPTYVDVVGGYFVTLAELRAMKNLSDATKFTTAELVEARQWFETTAERYCGQAFVPRYRRKRFSGDSTRSLYVDPNVRTIRRVRDYVDATTYTAYTADELADINANIDPAGWLHRTSGAGWRWGVRNIEVIYEHGMDACPDDLRLAAKNAIRHRLLDDETGHRPYAEQTDVGFLRFSRPGLNRPVGDDDIDTVLNGYKLIAVG